MGTDFTKKSTYNYALPQELIAQTPIEPRTASRLLCLDRQNGDILHHRYRGHAYRYSRFLHHRRAASREEQERIFLERDLRLQTVERQEAR